MKWYEKIQYFFRRSEETQEDEEFSFTGESDLNYDGDPFLHSLANLEPEDIRLAKEPHVPTKSERITDWIRRGMLVVCVAVFVVSCIMLLDNILQKQKGAALYDEAAAEFAAAGLDFGFDMEMSLPLDEGALAHLRAVKADSTVISLTQRLQEGEAALSDGIPQTPEYNEQLEKLRAVLRSYKEQNEDVYGYISIPAVGLEYVVVQGEDNAFYLNHNYKGDYLVIGSIYVDYRCDETMMKNFNTVFYGHNVITNNGSSMFHNVTKFLDKDVFDTGLIYIYTMDGVYVFKPFSIYDTAPDSGYIRTGFTSYDDFVSFAADMKARSRFETDIEIGPTDRMITLSTCTNIGDGKYALHAVMIDAIT